MTVPAAGALAKRLETLWRMESPQLIARLARMLRGDIGRAEELVQDCWLTAWERWAVEGIPDNPAAWLTTAARNRAVDVLRQRQRVDEQHARWGELLHPAAPTAPDDSEALADDIGDDLLRLLFVACHPLLPADARVALTLRLLGGLTTAEIARAFLQTEATIAQRIVRAKRTLAEAGIAFEVPRQSVLADRLQSVLEVIYLVFNEGYAASSGDAWMRPALCEEALRLARIVVQRLPSQPAALGLLALLELQAARSAARTDAHGGPVLLEQQNRARWDWLQIARGRAVLRQALACGGTDEPYVLQAGIAECHAQARQAQQTDWPRIAALYQRLLQVQPSPVVALNHAVAVSRADGPWQAWALLQPLLDDPRVQAYAPLWAVRGELLQQLGRTDDARHAFARAAALTGNAAERSLLRRRAGGDEHDASLLPAPD